MLQSNVRRGELDREITFIEKDLSTGASNADHIDSWVAVSTDPTVMARRKDMKGDVVMESERLSYSQRTLWTIDYREDLTIENRLVYNTKVFEILAITENNSGRETYLDVMTHYLDNQLWT